MTIKTNKILPFAVNAESNDLLNDDEYQTDVTRTGGNIVGIAKRRPNNKALKQASLIASALADIIARGSVFDGSKDDGYDIDDSLDRDTIAEYLFNTFTGIIKETSADDDTLVHIANAETITGAKTFTQKLVAQNGVQIDQNPATDNDAVRKAYIDDNFTLLPVKGNSNSNANTFVVPRRYACDSTIANLPVKKNGYIDVYRVSNFNTIVQVYYPVDNTSIYARNSTDGGSKWDEWKLQTILDLSAYVKTVNNVAPDDNGNVNIEIPDIKTTVLNTFFPVGSIYMDATGKINPNTQFGGTWEKIQNRFLYGAGSKAIGATGGAETVTLTLEQMPTHSHARGGIQITGDISDSGNQVISGRTSGAFSLNSANVAKIARGGSGTIINKLNFTGSSGWSGNSASQGNSKSHENMPPYIVVTIWKRTA